MTAAGDRGRPLDGAGRELQKEHRAAKARRADLAAGLHELAGELAGPPDRQRLRAGLRRDSGVPVQTFVANAETVAFGHSLVDLGDIDGDASATSAWR